MLNFSDNSFKNFYTVKWISTSDFIGFLILSIGILHKLFITFLWVFLRA